eukprot:7555434-Lingulodinium_polyedra.AAC.1
MPKRAPYEFASTRLPFGVASTLQFTRGQPRPESAQVNGVPVPVMPALFCFAGGPGTLNSTRGQPRAES